MAPPPTSVSWSDGLPVELLVLIFLNLHCIADCASFAAVCHRWRDTKRVAEAGLCAQPPPRQMPWLLSPSTSQGQGPSITSFLSGLRRQIRSLPDDVSRSRLCGSHPGGCVVATKLDSWGVQLLFNVRSRLRILLPQKMKVVRNGVSTVTSFIIRSVALSAAPDTDRCLARAIVSGTSNVAFCRPGVDSCWKGCFPEVNGLQNRVYYEGEEMRGFHVLTEEGYVGVFQVAEIEGRGTAINTRVTYYSIAPLRRADRMLRYLPSSTSVTCYLVVSRQRLLMVERYFVCEGSDGMCRTLLFRVFEMQAMVLPRGHRMASWVERESLDCRVLFLGRGCSRAYEASQLHGFKEGSIYFMDDAKFDLAFAPEYPCSDVGMYSMSTVVVRPSLDALTANVPSPVYGITTYLCWLHTKNKLTNKARKFLVEMREGEARSGGSKIAGIRWNFPSDESLSKFSPPIWFAP